MSQREELFWFWGSSGSVGTVNCGGGSGSWFVQSAGTDEEDLMEIHLLSRPREEPKCFCSSPQRRGWLTTVLVTVRTRVCTRTSTEGAGAGSTFMVLYCWWCDGDPSLRQLVLSAEAQQSVLSGSSLLQLSGASWCENMESNISCFHQHTETVLPSSQHSEHSRTKPTEPLSSQVKIWRTLDRLAAGRLSVRMLLGSLGCSCKCSYVVEWPRFCGLPRWPLNGNLLVNRDPDGVTTQTKREEVDLLNGGERCLSGGLIRSNSWL